MKTEELLSLKWTQKEIFYDEKLSAGCAIFETLFQKQKIQFKFHFSGNIKSPFFDRFCFWELIGCSIDDARSEVIELLRWSLGSMLSFNPIDKNEE